MIKQSDDKLIDQSDDQMINWLENQMIKLPADQEAGQRSQWDWNQSDPVITSDDQFIRWLNNQMIRESNIQIIR